jgi:hypothetical protein
MNDPRFDSRLRNALQRVPTLSDPDTTHALHDVLERSRSRKPRAWVPIATAAVITGILMLVLPLVLGSDRDLSQRPSQTPPSGPAVEGIWQRTVRGAADHSWNGPWTMTLRGNGVLMLAAPAGARNVDDGASFDVSGGQVRFDAFINGVCPEQTPGTYRWARTGSRLTLVPLTEACAIRQDLFAGTWTGGE